MTDMTNKNVIITGGNSGIGLEAAVGLAKLGATVVIACRNPTKANAALSEIVQRSQGGDVSTMSLDLASFASIRGFAKEAIDRFDRIDVLLNNAGLVVRSRQETADGFEQTFGVNHLGHFLLTDLLLERITSTPGSRIVTVASDAHKFVGKGLDLDDLQSQRSYAAFKVYGKSKLANILFTRELARRLAGSTTTANCLHPGFVASNFGRDDPLGKIAMVIGRPFAISAERGALTSIHLASDPTVASSNGAYFYKCAERAPSAKARDDAMASALWDASVALVESRS